MTKTAKPKALKKSEILRIPAIKDNILSNLILSKFMKNSTLDFDKMIKTLESFLKTDTLDSKLRFLFFLYDTDNDGHISSLELFQLLKILNRGVLEDNKLQNIIDRTFAETGEYKTEMNFEDFSKLLLKNNSNLKILLKCDK